MACCDHHAGWADAPECEDEREQAEAALADALGDERLDSLPILDVAQAALGWLAEDGWELVRLNERRDAIAALVREHGWSRDHDVPDAPGEVADAILGLFR